MKFGAVLVALLSLCCGLSAKDLPTVVILATGGTIASKRNPVKGGYELALTGKDLIEAIPAVHEFAQIRVEQISNISSTDMNPAIWIQLASKVNDLLMTPEVTGVVVTHGTNTLEETAYFLDLVTKCQYRLNKGSSGILVSTGGMAHQIVRRPADEIGGSFSLFYECISTSAEHGRTSFASPDFGTHLPHHHG